MTACTRPHVRDRVWLVFATIKEVHDFGYDERLAGKGANVAASSLQNMVDIEVARLLGMGGKLKHLILWCDSM
jgi:hypothetical protein